MMYLFILKFSFLDVFATFFRHSKLPNYLIMTVAFRQSVGSN